MTAEREIAEGDTCAMCGGTGSTWEEDSYLIEGHRLLHHEYCRCHLGQRLEMEEEPPCL